MATGCPSRFKGDAGFTIVELLIGLLIGLAVMFAAYGVMDSQSRLFSATRETSDARGSVRAAAGLLRWELLNLSASGGDVYAAGPTGMTVRSVQGTGTVCSKVKVGSTYRVGLQQASGFFEATADDSALVFARADKTWRVVKVTAAWNGNDAWTSGGTSVCFWGDSTTSMPRPQAALELQGDSTALAFIRDGAPLRVFRRTEYALFASNGEWWLGRKIGAAASFDLLTGPMWAPSDSGLVLRYFDATGSVTATPSQIARVDVDLRGRSSGLIPVYGSSPRALDDSVSTTVFLRNSAAP